MRLRRLNERPTREGDHGARTAGRRAAACGRGFASLAPGFTLVEVMLSIGLLVVFLTLAGRLLLQSMKVSVESQRREEVAHRFDLAMEQLRRDVWSARTIESDGGSATLRRPDGAAVTWRVEPEPADDPSLPPTVRLTRSDPSSGEVSPGWWGPLPAGLAFESEGPALRVLAPSAREPAGGRSEAGKGGTDRLTLVSQFALAGGTR